MTHPSAGLTLDPAKAADIEWLVGAVTALAREDGHGVAPDIAALLAELIGDEHLGTAFVLRADGVAIGCIAGRATSTATASASPAAPQALDHDTPAPQAGDGSRQEAGP